jgi:hypothetical protein
VLSIFWAFLPFPYGGPDLRLFTCALVISWWLYFLDICSYIGYLQGLFYRYHESYKGRTTHNLYGGLPLRGDLTDYVVELRRALTTDYDTSNILKGFSSPSWVRNTYSSEGGPFSTTISHLSMFGLFALFWCAL